MNAERQRIINELKRQKREIEQQFNGIKRWNRLHPEEEPIDPDPDGQLGRIHRAIKRTLDRDTGSGPIAPLLQ